jgi:trehalose-phosphatase
VLEVEIRGEEERAEPLSRRLASAQRTTHQAARSVRNLFDAWPGIIERLKGAEFRLLLLDFDGTLVRLRRRPEDVRFSARGKKILRRLVGLKDFSATVVTGRGLESIETMVGVEGVRYVGLHGAARNGKSMAVSRAAQQAMARARKEAQSKLRELPGIWIEDKGLIFAVHYRGAAHESAEEAGCVLRRIVAPLRKNLRILNGDCVWEVLPREIQGKGAAVLELLAGLPDRTVAMYIGDDRTDEEAFAVLPGHITVKVGDGQNTSAGFYVRTPAEVLQLLSRFEKELR